MRKTRFAGILITAALATGIAGFVPAHADDRVVVGTDVIGDGPLDADPAVAPVTAAAGLDATELDLHRVGGSLEFIIKVTDLPTPPPNEVIRYLWQFKVRSADQSERLYWVTAKTSDITTATTAADDPQGHFTHLSGAFRLRGNCTSTGVSTCHHLKWLDGTFDTTNNEIRMLVPLDDPKAPDFTAGSVIAPAAGGMTASIQAVVSNASTSDTVDQSDEYTIPA